MVRSWSGLGQRLVTNWSFFGLNLVISSFELGQFVRSWSAYGQGLARGWSEVVIVWLEVGQKFVKRWSEVS